MINLQLNAMKTVEISPLEHQWTFIIFHYCSLLDIQPTPLLLFFFYVF